LFPNNQLVCVNLVKLKSILMLYPFSRFRRQRLDSNPRPLVEGSCSSTTVPPPLANRQVNMATGRTWQKVSLASEFLAPFVCPYLITKYYCNVIRLHVEYSRVLIVNCKIDFKLQDSFSRSHIQNSNFLHNLIIS
jgi:hypothetical protein